MKILDTELRYIDSIWNSVVEGHIEYLSHFDVTLEDLNMMQEYARFKRALKHEHVNGVIVISLEDAKKLLSFFQYFKVSADIEDKCLWVLYRSESGYDSRDDVWRYYILELFTCVKCGNLARPFYIECDSCISKEKVKIFDPAI